MATVDARVPFLPFTIAMQFHMEVRYFNLTKSCFFSLYSGPIPISLLIARGELSNGVITTDTNSPKLLRISNRDSSTVEQRLKLSSPHTIRDMPESEGRVPEDQPSPSACTLSRNWSLIIDQVARVLFPFMYAVFTIVYFVMILN